MIYKNCPNCGARINNDLRFCPNCGFDFTAQTRPNGQPPLGQTPYLKQMASQHQPTSPQRRPAKTTPQRTRQQSAKASTKLNQNYWQFLLSGLAHPLAPTQIFNAKFGLISLSASALLVALATLVSHLDAGHSFSIGLHSFLLLLFSNFIIATFAFVARRFFLGDRQMGYLATVTNFAHYSTLTLLLGLILLIWALFDLNLAIYYLLFIIGGIWLQMAFLITIYHTNPKTKMDRGYAYLLALCLTALVIGILIAILGVSTLMSLFQSATFLDGF